jgi:uncharacterized protein YrrD
MMEANSITADSLIAADKVEGTNVYNLAGEKLGSVDDILIDKASGRAVYAIMSFGGFVGIRERMVVVPFQSLRIANDRIMLPGGTKAELMELAEFKYAVK